MDKYISLGANACMILVPNNCEIRLLSKVVNDVRRQRKVFSIKKVKYFKL